MPAATIYLTQHRALWLVWYWTTELFSVDLLSLNGGKHDSVYDSILYVASSMNGALIWTRTNA